MDWLTTLRYKGALDAAWMRILDWRHLSRLRPATADEPTEGEPIENEPTQAPATDNQSSKEADRERIREVNSEDIGDSDSGDSKEKDWGTWTTLRPSEGREDFSAEVDMNTCSEKVSPFVRDFVQCWSAFTD